MKRIKELLYGNGSAEEITRSGVVWNVLSSTLYAALSAILLIIVTRVNGKHMAGLFTITFSISQMMYCIGNYGMRNYQVSDVEARYTFSTYLKSRYISCFIMMVITYFYIKVKGYNTKKEVMLLLLCILKASDAIGDVYEGAYQVKDRLDIAAKTNFIRVFIYMIGFCISLLITRNVNISILVAVIISFVFLLYFVVMTRDLYRNQMQKQSFKEIYNVLYECFPLCLGAYLLVYLCNAPKYAIDAHMSTSIQAIYGYLFMPCFVISLLVQFVIRPILLKLSVAWNDKNSEEFISIVMKLVYITLGLTVLVVIGGYFLGCPVLSIIYGVKLNSYRVEFSILLIGGGIYSLAVVLQTVLTVMRRQYLLIIGFIVSSILTYFLSSFLVLKWGILGASFTYVATNLLLLSSFVVMMVVVGRKELKHK